MFTYHYFAKASLGLSLVFALIHPASSQITPNGAGTLVNPQGNQINISGGTQTGGNLFHSFQDFNVNANQVANFLSNPQTQNILGRINGGNPSFINGLLQVMGGNSNLFLMNPAGIVFGQGSSLNVPASFTATTANQIGFGNNIFNAFGNNNFSALTGNPDSFIFTTNQAGSIINAGNLSVTPGQGISLLGGNIVNTGNINAGNITLAAVPGTNRVRISQPGHLLSLEITPTADSAIAPLDLPMLLTGQSLPGITNNGETVQVAGVTIPAGQGVNVTSGNLSTFSQGGFINILGDRVTLLNANLNANGVEGGGTIRVGGEYRGGGNNPFNARITYVDSGSFLSADALNAGNGGRVIIWGDDTTRFYGNIAARGGTNGGNGGFAEVSGAQTLTFAGNADLSAPRGSFGTLLLDPVNILISNGADVLGGCTLPNITLGCDSGDITISQATLEGLSAATNIVLEASNNITFGTLAGGSLNFFTCDAGVCGDITFTAGGAFNTNGNNINALGRNLSITAASITAENINTSISTISRNGGNINLVATTGNVITGTLDSGSSVATGNAGNGGNITIDASNGTVTTGEVNSRSVAVADNSGTGGNIAITAQSINAGTVNSYTNAAGNSGNAGSINLLTSGNIVTTLVSSYSSAFQGTSSLGGNINISSTNGSINTGEVRSYSISASLLTGNASNGGNINLSANGNITATNVVSNSTAIVGISATGGNISINSTNGSINAGNVFSNSGTVDVITQFGNSGNGGSINLQASGNIAVTDVLSASSTQGTSATGGNIRINSTNGSINARDIFSLSGTNAFQVGNSGNGGTIDLLASGNVTTADVRSVSGTFLGSSGSGGDINITSTNGGINSGSVNSFSSSPIQAGNSGNGGNITLLASGDINTINVQSPSFTPQAAAATGGNIRVNSTGGSINAGVIASFSSGITQIAGLGNAGTIDLLASGNITAASVDASSTTRNGDSGNGGTITINSANGSTTANSIYTYSGTFNGTNAGSGGNISIDLPSGNLTVNGGTTNLGAIGSGAFDNVSNSTINSGSGGLININIGGNLFAANSIRSGSTFGSGGAITINSGGSITSPASISSNSRSGNAGLISLNAGSNISLDSVFARNTTGGIGGSIDIVTPTLFRATGSFTNALGTLVSVASDGANGGGAITITHGGSTTTPFIVGSPSSNGTVAAISSGSGANTIDNLTVPVPPAINNYGTNISIRTTAPTPTPTPTPSTAPTPTPTPTIVPTPTPSASPITITEPINPNPPRTPDPVIVGTPPILVVAPVPFAPIVNLPVNPPSTGQTIVTSPTINNPNPVVPPIINNPPLVVPPPSPTNPQLSRPILEANSPGAQSPISLAAANSNIPIIDRIPVDSLNNKIRLLDDPFKEEFQAFTGISDEIATLDVNQAQDILQRIIRETNTKPVFIYVFFAPENEVERNVNSARGLSSSLRVAQDTDILEVVLVPPTGDLVQIKYPGLKRPQVMEIAQKLFTFTAKQSNGYISPARQFHEWLITPLQDELKKREINNLVFLMDVGLRSIPLAAMRDQQNGDRFIIEDYSVGLMPSLTLTDTSYTSLKGSEVLGMGADNFVGASPLHAVPLELNAINQLWGGSTLFNENFTLNNLRQARRPGQRIVHLATHGSFNPGEKSNSYIQLWGNERLTLDQIRQAGWDNPPVDLLVLSACETALGNRESELGFAGLAVQAGVKSALASLWLVSDEGTFGLMTDFYQQLQETTTKSEALRLAQLAMLREEVRLEGGNLITPQGTFPLNEELKKLGDRSLQHPYFWSGFTMVGNPW